MRHERLDSFSESQPILNQRNDIEDIEEKASTKSTYSFDCVFFRRLFRLLKILFKSSHVHRPWSTTREARKHSLFWLYMTFIALSIGYEVLVYFVGMIPSRFYSILTSRDIIGFSKYIFPCLLLVFSTAACKSFLNFMGGLFALKARKLLTIHFQEKYIKPKAMYTLVMNYERIDNPDQRITQDIEKFAETLRQIVTSLIIAPIMVVYYTYKCWIVTGFGGPLLIYVYFLFGSLVSRKFIQPIVNAVFFKELQEGNFRYLHVRLRQYAESIAFCDGEKEENSRAQHSLDTLLTYQRTIVNKELPLKMANESFSYLGSILSYLIIAIPIFAGAFDGKDASELSAIISANSFVAMYLIYLFSTMIEQSSKVSDLAGFTARIGELLEALDRVAVEVESIGTDHSRRKEEQSDDVIEFESVSLFSPRCKLIVHDLNLKIYQGDHVAFVGPNGSGKTSILRSLAGLWPCSEGRVLVPRVTFGRDIIFLPQLPYLIDGSLRDQILYPNTTPAATITVTDQEIVQLLQSVRLSHLAGLVRSYDTVYSQEWSKMLSPGEQQRLVFARVFYWKPSFTILDEATSAMDKDTEDYLYQAVINMGTTVISVSHHPNVVDFHSTVVRLDGQGGYTVENKEASSSFSAA
ncbi:ATP-binding cassette sub-family D member 4-like protein [Parasitella parasitica]|nr:ATP-binding cassette sub-family D member 4-like protein [Parasitella parasitica]